jgi:protein gp37
MSDGTGIEWTDATWNPLVGCTKVSPGCDHCYAETLVNRFAGTSVAFPTTFDTVNIRGEKMLTQPLRWSKPRRVFVNSLSDLFHADVPDEFIARVFAVMAAAPRHTFQLLTKRHARMRSLLNSPRWPEMLTEAAEWPLAFREGEPVGLDIDPEQPLPNVWLGVSVEDQQWADIRIPALLDTPAAVRWISAEPLLGPVSLYTRHDDHPVHGGRLDWVVVGGESGPSARPMSAEWARSLRDECARAGIPFLFKQWGNHDEHGRHVGKKRAGRLLDGVQHDGYPTLVGAS